jgi:hypothetical protein
MHTHRVNIQTFPHHRPRTRNERGNRIDHWFFLPKKSVLRRFFVAKETATENPVQANVISLPERKVLPLSKHEATVSTRVNYSHHNLNLRTVPKSRPEASLAVLWFVGETLIYTRSRSIALNRSQEVSQARKLSKPSKMHFHE